MDQSERRDREKGPRGRLRGKTSRGDFAGITYFMATKIAIEAIIAVGCSMEMRKNRMVCEGLGLAKRVRLVEEDGQMLNEM